MKIRLEGTAAEIATAVESLRLGFEVQEVSHFYANRGESVLGRVYVTASPLGGVIQAKATRADSESTGRSKRLRGRAFRELES
ncbi:hypothetical protein SAMN05216188_1467 [Lentzea xinjiangensis]|uniref:Uncharacterized protein n=1 Tax=Lentzea xinjiangensis TaxID=402600 RepID=A0A1H9WVV8_9PSEU|nr:hypothetical protein [Lentzea xinjiangensis]SES37901.1 hypothetical protein SAMN05216188_1467 [Lentzea xinjiangensis]